MLYNKLVYTGVTRAKKSLIIVGEPNSFIYGINNDYIDNRKTTLKDLIINKGVDLAYGARPLRRAMQNILEDKIVEEILDGNLEEGDKAKAVIENDEVKIDKL